MIFSNGDAGSERLTCKSGRKATSNHEMEATATVAAAITDARIEPGQHASRVPAIVGLQQDSGAPDSIAQPETNGFMEAVRNHSGGLSNRILFRSKATSWRGGLESKETIMAETRKSVYLAGPMTGCSVGDKSTWRNEAKRRYRDQFAFVDPVESGVDESESTFDRVTQDRKDIERCDAILANLWKMSSGTVVGIVLAKNKGKIVVLVDEHNLASPILHFYCDAIVRDVSSGIKELITLLGAGPNPALVSKRNGTVSPFRRSKLAMSLRKACQSAGVDDVTYPVFMLPEILEEVRGVRPIRGCISTEAIAAAVLTALDRKVIAEKHSEYNSCVARVRDAWRKWVQSNRPARFASASDPELIARDALVRGEPIRLRVSSEKSHQTIWGTAVKSIDSLPSEAREVFREISRVRGIASISLTAFRAKSMNVAPHKPRVSLALSNNPSIIAGSLLVRGKIGHQQNFDVHLHDPNERDIILSAIRNVLTPKFLDLSRGV